MKIFKKRRKGLYSHQPLHTRQRTDHKQPHRQSVPKPTEANIAIDPAHCLTNTFASLAVRIELTDHDICRVRDSRAANTGNVATEEGDTSLLDSRVLRLLLSKVPVDRFDRLFKRRKLDHRVWDLPSPQRRNTLVQTCDTFFRDNLLHANCHVWRKGRQRGLHADFDSFKGAEKDVGKELRTGASSQIHNRFISVGK